MKKIVLSSSAIVLLSSAVGIVAFGTTAQQRTAIAQVLAPDQERVEATATSSTTDVPQVSITETYAHQVGKRPAVTVYVRDIPVVTFLGKKKVVANTPAKVVGNETDSSNAIADDDPMTAAKKFAADVEKMNLVGTKADTIKVKWDKASKQYMIHAANENIIAISKTVILPKTTKDKAEDALQITNLLRRQLGAAEPVKEIEGRPVVKKTQQVAVGATRYQVQGWASWYGPGFHGNLTASGRRFNQYALTAAHRTLPFGSRVRVTNLDTGRSVVVTINDRGPFIHNRVIDLSQGAAQAIGVMSAGVAPVRLDILQ